MTGLPTEVTEGLSNIVTQIGAMFNISNIIAVVLMVFGISLGLAAFWFFGRFIIKKIMGAFKSGKVGI